LGTTALEGVVSTAGDLGPTGVDSTGALGTTGVDSAPQLAGTETVTVTVTGAGHSFCWGTTGVEGLGATGAEETGFSSAGVEGLGATGAEETGFSSAGVEGLGAPGAEEVLGQSWQTSVSVATLGGAGAEEEATGAEETGFFSAGVEGLGAPGAEEGLGAPGAEEVLGQSWQTSVSVATLGGAGAEEETAEAVEAGTDSVQVSVTTLGPGAEEEAAAEEAAALVSVQGTVVVVTCSKHLLSAQEVMVRVWMEETTLTSVG